MPSATAVRTAAEATVTVSITNTSDSAKRVGMGIALIATILGVEHDRDHRLAGNAKRYDFPGDTRVTLFTAPKRSGE